MMVPFFNHLQVETSYKMPASHLANPSGASEHDGPVDSQQLLHQEAKPHCIHCRHQQVKVRDISAVLEGRDDLLPWLKAAAVEVYKVAEQIT